MTTSAQSTMTPAISIAAVILTGAWLVGSLLFHAARALCGVALAIGGSR